MKMKTKLPLLFLLMFVLITMVIFIFITSLVSVDGHMAIGTIMSPIHLQMFLFLSILMGIVFVVLTVYFHFTITKPIQILNTSLTKVNIGQSRISPQSRRKDEIGELYKHFNEMEERLYSSHKEQVNMISAIAHDLKTPLTTITGFMELLTIKQNLTEREKQEYYKLIMKKSNHMVELVNAFSAFTKDELMLEDIEVRPIKTQTFIENIASEYETELSSLDYKLKWKHSFNQPQFILANEHMIRRVFGNLFSNAVRYGGKKDLTVYLTGYSQGDYAYFQIEDDGVGVPDKEMSFLFHKFFTVDKSRQMNYGGTGLGLASCRSIIENHGGKISTFRSTHGGLGIRFSLPLALETNT